MYINLKINQNYLIWVIEVGISAIKSLFFFSFFYLICIESTRPIKRNCQLLSCRQKEAVDWEIIDPKKGELKVSFQDYPKYCNFGAYGIDLEIYEEEAVYEESLMCNSDNPSWITHSRRLFENPFCSNCSIQSSEECLQVKEKLVSPVILKTFNLKFRPGLESRSNMT